MEFTFEAYDFISAQKIALLVVEAVQKELSGPRSGRWYPTPGNIYYDRMTTKENRAKNYWIKFMGATRRDEIVGGAYQASAPGEAPAVRTGRLRQSFYIDVTPTGEGRYKGRVITNIIYADDLEYGNEKVEARPFLHPAVEKTMPKILEIQKDTAYKILRGI